jgi:hypothetical protein
MPSGTLQPIRVPLAWQGPAALALAAIPLPLVFLALGPQGNLFWIGGSVCVAASIAAAIWGIARIRRDELRGMELCQAALLADAAWIMVIAGGWLALRGLAGMDGV